MRADLTSCGTEAVAVSEWFYSGLFITAIAFVGLTALVSLVLLPTRGLPPGAPIAAASALTGLIVVLTPLALWRVRALYRALRRRPRLQLVLVLVAVVLVAHPTMSGELWWPSCAIVTALAIVTSLRRTLAYCLLVLGTNLAGHVVAGDLHETPAVAVIGLWIGYPLWVGTIALVTDHLVAEVLRTLAAQTTRTDRAPPRRVRAWTEPLARNAASVGNRVAVSSRESSAGGLTARQIQVVALLADGMRYRQIAACLAISVRQVERHVADAITRAGVRNATQLVAVAVSDGTVLPARRDAAISR
jgi:DNA-binding CsgD family transcriptional regulator